jgi:hypothetical protein
MKKIVDSKAKKSDLLKVEGSEIIPQIRNFVTNPNIPTHHADMVSCLFGSDGSTLISFFARTPGINVEECRVSFSQVLAKKLVDMISSHLDYYPQKSLTAEVKEKEIIASPPKK